MFARRVSRAASPSRSPANISPPATQQWRGGMAGQSCLRSAALQFSNLPGEGSEEQGRAAGSARRSFQSRSPSGASRAGRDPAPVGPGGHKCTAASLPSCLPGQGVPPETSPLVISSTWELPTYIYFFFWMLLYCFPSLCLFSASSCGSGVDRGEELEGAGSDRTPWIKWTQLEKRQPERARRGRTRWSAAGERGGRQGAEPGAGGSTGAPAPPFRN